MRADQQDLHSPRTWGDMTVLAARTLALRCRGRCGRPHWGYVIRGVVRVAYPDHEEVIAAGDAYYVAPGHIAVHLGDAELVDFGPRDPHDGPADPGETGPTVRTTPKETPCDSPPPGPPGSSPCP